MKSPSAVMGYFADVISPTVFLGGLKDWVSDEQSAFAMVSEGSGLVWKGVAYL